MILPIGEWVLRTACRQAKAWHDEGLPLTRMAVNVSGQQFALREFPAMVAEIIKETGIAPSMLELEITESVVMKDEAWAEQALAQLKELGILLAIDDFGTGYSSFGRLRNFAVDRSEDRPVIHDQPGRMQRRSGHRGRDHRDVALAADQRDGGGRRKFSAAAVPAGACLPGGARVLVQPAAAGGGRT